MINEKDNDFKYVLQEFARTMIGAKYTYGELLDAERIPFKFQTIVDRLILPYADPDMTIEDHLLSITKDDKNFRIYDNLKLKIKYFMHAPKGGFKEHTDEIKEFVKKRENWTDGCMVQEIIISNLALMGFKM